MAQTVKDTYSWLQGIDDSLSDIAEVMKDNTQEAQPSHSREIAKQQENIKSSINLLHHGLEHKMNYFVSGMSILNENIVPVLISQQTLAKDFSVAFTVLTDVLATTRPTSSSSGASSMQRVHSLSATPSQLEEHVDSSEGEDVGMYIVHRNVQK